MTTLAFASWVHGFLFSPGGKWPVCSPACLRHATGVLAGRYSRCTPVEIWPGWRSFHQASSNRLPLALAGDLPVLWLLLSVMSPGPVRPSCQPHQQLPGAVPCHGAESHRPQDDTYPFIVLTGVQWLFFRKCFSVFVALINFQTLEVEVLDFWGRSPFLSNSFFSSWHSQSFGFS